MAPGEPARAPALPSLAVCAERPFRFDALTFWLLRHRSMPWAILHLCRSRALKLGALRRYFEQNMELCAR